jgi:hypothetical protein
MAQSGRPWVNASRAEIKAPLSTGHSTTTTALDKATNKRLRKAKLDR